MRRRYARLLIAILLALGLVGLRPHLTLAAGSTVSDCPTTEPALSSDISTAGDGGTVAFTCTAATTIEFDSADGGTGPLSITQGVTLDASTATGAVTLDGNNASQLFIVQLGGNLTLRHLTLAHGYTGSGNGGAIDNLGGTVTITDSTLSGNAASGDTTTTGGGGAIFNGGYLTVANSTLSGNTAAGGGAIDNGAGPVIYGSLSITTSTLSGNVATGDGGAILNFGGTATITGSTLSGNTAHDGGVINTLVAGTGDPPVTVSIATSTLSGNSATTRGGAIEMSNDSGGFPPTTVSIANSTLAGNSASTGGAVYAQANSGGNSLTITRSTLIGNSATTQGGGIFRIFSALAVGQTIIANNTSPSGGNCAGTAFVTDGGYNLTDSNGSCGLTGATDLVNTDPLLGTLADNGGPTQTLVPRIGSPAVDAGPSGTACTGTDQRGVPRPQGAACDIGAVEQDITAPTVTVSFPAPPTGQDGYFNATQVPVIGSVSATDSGIVASLACTGASVSNQTGLGTTSVSATLTVSADGLNKVSCVADDIARNRGFGNDVTVPVDTTPPAASPAVTRGTAGNSPWYTSDVTVGWNWSDGGSGINPSNCTTSTASSGEGSLTLSASCTDLAGNTGTATDTVNVDKTAPVISEQSDTCSNPGSNGWCAATETTTFGYTDATSGMASPCTANPGVTCTEQVSSTGDGAAVTLSSGSAQDVAGNTQSAITSGPFLIDATPPTVTCTTPAPTFTLNQEGASVSATVADATSGPAQASVSAAADTSSVGSFSASVTGADNAGNATTVSCPYRVKVATTTTLGSSANPSIVGQPVTYTAMVAPVAPATGVPSGTVSFADGGAAISDCTNPATLASGTASCQVPYSSPGSHTITAAYSGDATDQGSTSSSLAQVVQYGTKLLYKAPISSNAGSTVNIKLELQKYSNGSLVNASASSLTLTALCVVPSGTSSCGTSPTMSLNKPFTFVATLDKGGGYQYSLKTPSTLAKGTYLVLFRAAGEASTTYHANAGATFTIG